jgi:hypothetical protein
MAHPSHALGVAGLLVVLSLAAGTATAEKVDEQETVHEGDHYALPLNNPSASGPWKIEVTWTSSLPIDVWLVDADALEDYEQGQAFAFDIQQKGTSGLVTFTVPSSRLADEPFYVVFDNTGAGDLAPPQDSVDDIATITATGKTRDTSEAGGTGGAGSDALLLGLAMLGALLLVIVFFVRMRKGRGAAAAQSSPGVPKATAGPGMDGSDHEGEAEAGQTGAAAETAPADSGACPSCGTPITVETTFCPSCGARI